MRALYGVVGLRVPFQGSFRASTVLQSKALGFRVGLGVGFRVGLGFRVRGYRM